MTKKKKSLLTSTQLATLRKGKVPRGIVLCIRTCDGGMGAYNDFRWPKKGYVECPDWDPVEECGNGLHGLLWGEGDGGLLDWSDGAHWLVFAAKEREVVALGGKVKVPRAHVLYCGEGQGAAKYVTDRTDGKACVRGTATAGDGGTATAGVRGTATAGDGGSVAIEHRDPGRGYVKKVAEVGGKSGLKPDTKYCIKNGEFVEAKD